MSGYVNERRGMRVTGEYKVKEQAEAAATSDARLSGRKRARIATQVATAASVMISAVGLSACASSPDSQYYTLSEGASHVAQNDPVAQARASELGTGSIAPGKTNATPNATPAGMRTQGGQNAQPLLIEVMPVNVPSQVSRPQIVTTTRDGKVDVHDYSRWSSPLDDEIGNALSEGLTRRLGAIDTYRTPRQAGTTAYQITVNVQRFVSIPDDTASIDAVWSIVRSSDQLTLTCRSSASEPIGHGFDNLAAGQRKALGRIADQIAQGVRIEVPVPVSKAPDIAVATPASAASSPAGKDKNGKNGHAMAPTAPTPAPLAATLPVLTCPY